MPEFETFVLAGSYDIVAVTETWYNEDFTDSMANIPGYSFFRSDRQHKSGGGCILYFKENMKVREIRPCERNDSYESVWCIIYGDNDEETVFGVIYITDQNKEKEEKLFEEIKQASKMRHVVITGDFNYPSVNWNTDECGSEARDFVDTINDCFLHQHVLESTRDKSQNILDLVFSSEEEMVKNVNVQEPLANSDHNSIYFEIVCCVLKTKTDDKPSRDYKRANWEEVHNYLCGIDWELEFVDKDANEQWEFFVQVVDKVIDKYVPFKKKMQRQKPKWMTYKCFQKIKRKRKKWNRHKRTGLPRHEEAYMKCLNECTKLVRETKDQYEIKMAKNIKDDCKTFYSYSRGKMRCKVKVGPIEDENGVLQTDDSKQAEILNNFFTSVFTKEDLRDRPEPEMRFTDKPENKLTDLEITPDMVLKKLRGLKPGKAPGVDCISSNFLIEAAESLAIPLAMIFQSSLDSSVVPEGWKQANVVPIFKKGQKSKAGNYRPVSLTSQVGKIFESIIRDAINKHFDTYDLINDSQHGFSKGKSCLTNLLVFIEDISRMLDEGKDVDIVYLDYAKAFDKVPHKRLIDKLRAHGVDGKVLFWIEEWLNGRKQRVMLNGIASSWSEVTSGVPQGSILGPTLFLVFINDLEDDMKTNVLKFADDTKIYGEASSTDGRDKLQHDLDTAGKWSESWQMTFNVDKCKTLHTGSKNVHHTYSLNQRQLNETETEKDLGVLMHKSMSFSEQCHEAAKKANRVAGQVMKTMTNKSKEVIVPLYKALVRPHLEYCVQVWNPFLRKDIDLLEKVQRRTTKRIKGLNNLSYDERLKVCNLPRLEDRRKRGDLIETFKIMKGFEKVPKERFFQRGSNQCRGHSEKLFKERPNSRQRQKIFSQRVISEWNALPQRVVDSKTIDQFKNRLDEHLGVKKSCTTAYPDGRPQRPLW